MPSTNKRPADTPSTPPTTRPQKRTKTTADVSQPVPPSNRASFTSLFSVPIFTEYFNKNNAYKLQSKLEHLVAAGFATDKDMENRANLNAMLELADGNDFFSTNYHQSWHYIQSGSDFNARFFASGVSTQHFSKKLRSTIVGGDLYYDFDFVNCQPSLLIQYANKIGVNAPILTRIVEDRDTVLSEIQTYDKTIHDREEAKKTVIKAMFGSKAIPNVPWWGSFVDEISALTDTVCNSRPDLVGAAIKKKGQDLYKPTVLSCFLGELENACMHALYVFLVDKELLTPGLCVLMFDGIQVLRNATNDAVLTNPESRTALFREAEDYITEKTNYRLGLALKDFAPGYDLPEDPPPQIPQYAMQMDVDQNTDTTTAELERIVGLEQAAGIAAYDPSMNPKTLSAPTPINPRFTDRKVITDTRNDSTVGLIPVSQKSVAISAACGMGKTRALVRYLRRLRKWSNIVIVHRKSMTQKLKHDLADCGAKVRSYRDVTGVIRVEPGEVWIVQIESIRRLDYENFNWGTVNLIMDEYNSLERQLYFAAADAHRAYKALLYNSHRAVILDAYLWNKHLTSFAKSRGCDDYVWYAKYTYLKSKIDGHNFYIKSGKQNGVDMIMECVGNDERVMSACINRTLAESIKRLVEDRFPGKKVLLITSQCSDSEKNFATSDVNRTWISHDLVIFTGTVEVGLSFEIANHFKRTIAIIDSNATTVEQVLQMVFRARDVKDYYFFVDRKICAQIDRKTIAIQLKEWESRLERMKGEFEGVLQNEVVDNDDFLGSTLKKTGFTHAMANVATHDYESKRSFPTLLVEYLQRYGGTIHIEAEENTVVPEPAAVKATKEMVDTIRTDEAKAICEAPFVTEQAYAALKSTDSLNPESVAKIQKHELCSFYGINHVLYTESLTTDTVIFLRNERNKKKFRNCKILEESLARNNNSVSDGLHALETGMISSVFCDIAEVKNQGYEAFMRGRIGKPIPVPDDAGKQGTQQMDHRCIYRDGSEKGVELCKGTNMDDVLGFRLATSKVGHFRLCEEVLQFMFGTDKGMSLADFNREFTEDEIAAVMCATPITITKTKPKRSRTEFIITDKAKLESFVLITKKLKEHPFFSSMHSKFTTPKHSKEFVYVSDIIVFATVVFGAVFGRPCVKDKMGDGTTVYVFAQNKACELISSIVQTVANE